MERQGEILEDIPNLTCINIVLLDLRECLQERTLTEGALIILTTDHGNRSIHITHDRITLNANNITTHTWILQRFLNSSFERGIGLSTNNLLTVNIKCWRTRCTCSLTSSSIILYFLIKNTI